MSQRFDIKKSVKDIWPIRNKRILLQVDPRLVLPTDSGNDTSLSTIRGLVAKGARAIIVTSFGEVTGLPASMSEEVRSVMIRAFQEENGMGYSNFFATRPAQDKVALLSQLRDAPRFSEVKGAGKSRFFATLPPEIRKELIELYCREKNLPIQFWTMSNREQYEIILKEIPNTVFVEDPLAATTVIAEMAPGSVVVLENLRLYAGEASANADEREAFARMLACYGDILVNDAFNVTYKTLASTTNLATLMRHCACGDLVARELYHFTALAAEPARPLMVVVGGSRIGEKLEVLAALLPKLAKVIVCGQVAVPFLQSLGAGVGKSAVSDTFIQMANDITRRAARLNIRIVLPVDHVVSTTLNNLDKDKVRETLSISVPSDCYIVDAGPKSIRTFIYELGGCRTIFWTGPLGLQGTARTLDFARALARTSAITVVGGRNTVAEVRLAGVSHMMTHLSAGGIACLDMLRGNALPGIDAMTSASIDLDQVSTSNISALLRYLPVFSRCTLQNVSLVARKAVRCRHARGEIIAHGGDRHGAMWLVTSGALVAYLPETAGQSDGQRIIGVGHAFGQYEFVAKSIGEETVIAQCDNTETYQISSTALSEAMLESPTLCLQLLQSLTDPLILISNREHTASSRLLSVLSRDMHRMRKPIPNPPSDITWSEDALVGSLAQGLASFLVGVAFDRSQAFGHHVRVGVVHAVHEAVRSIAYHNLISVAPQDAAMPLVAASVSGFFTVPFRFIAARKTEVIRSPEAMISGGLRMAAVSWLPVFSQGIFLQMRRRLERYTHTINGTPSPIVGVPALLLAVLARAIASLCFFPVESRSNGFSGPNCARKLQVFLLKQITGLLIQVVAISFFRSRTQRDKSQQIE